MLALALQLTHDWNLDAIFARIARGLGSMTTKSIKYDCIIIPMSLIATLEFSKSTPSTPNEVIAFVPTPFNLGKHPLSLGICN